MYRADARMSCKFNTGEGDAHPTYEKELVDDVPELCPHTRKVSTNMKGPPHGDPLHNSTNLNNIDIHHRTLGKLLHES